MERRLVGHKMMTFYPKLGIGPIRFGMTESEVRRALTSAPHAVSQRDPLVGTRAEALSILSDIRGALLSGGFP